MRALQLTSLIAIAALFSGCQHLHLTPTASQTSNVTTGSASAPTQAISSKPTSSKPFFERPLLQRPLLQLGQALPWHKNTQSLHDYQAECLAKSRLHQPQLSGNVINTPRYALVTLQRASNIMTGGELCIVNKITHSVEITAIDNLEYIPHSTVSKDSLVAAQ
jgi:hypothetical protein